MTPSPAKEWADGYGKELTNVRDDLAPYIETGLQTAHGPAGGLSMDDLSPDDIELARRDEPDTARSLVPGLEKAAAGLGLSRSYMVKVVKVQIPDEARTGRTRWGVPGRAAADW
jgi:hypothetical protein